MQCNIMVMHVCMCNMKHMYIPIQTNDTFRQWFSSIISDIKGFWDSLVGFTSRSESRFLLDNSGFHMQDSYKGMQLRRNSNFPIKSLRAISASMLRRDWNHLVNCVISPSREIHARLADAVIQLRSATSNNLYTIHLNLLEIVSHVQSSGQT